MGSSTLENDLHADHCMDAKGSLAGTPGGRVQIYQCHGRSNQQWTLGRKSGSTYELKLSNGMCLEPDRRAQPTDGIRVTVWTCDQSTRQQWSTVSVDGRFLLANLAATQAAGHLVVIRPETSTSGAPLRIYDYDQGAVDQIWLSNTLHYCYSFVTRCP